MDALKKRMIIRFTPYQTISHSKWMFSQNFGSNHPCCYTQYTVQCTVRVQYMVSAAPQPAASTVTFSSVFILLL